MRLSSVLSLIVFSFMVSIANAADNVVVIPVNTLGQGLKNIITVSAQGGDYTDPLAAVDAIKDASESNPYLVIIGPGVYVLSETLVMKPYVTVAGSGKEVTTLSATTTESPWATISGADNTILRDLTIKHDANGAARSRAIYLQTEDFAVYNVTAEAFGGNDNTAIFNDEGTMTLVNVTASATNGANNVGIRSSIGVIALENVVASASGGTNTNEGIRNSWSPATIRNSIITATGGTTSYGIRNSTWSNLSITNSSISTSDASDSNFGVQNSSLSSVKITNVKITAKNGQNTFGIDVETESGAELRDVTISATSGSAANYGVRSGEYCGITLSNVFSKAAFGSSSHGVLITGEESTATIRRSTIKGSTNGLYCDFQGTATVSQTTIIGGGGGGKGIRTCVACDDGNGAELNSACL